MIEIAGGHAWRTATNPHLLLIDIQDNGDFIDLHSGHRRVALKRSEFSVKAGRYALNSTIRIAMSNVHMQGEGMGITFIRGNSQVMTGNPAVPTEAFQTGVRARLLIADRARGDTSVQLSVSGVFSHAM